MSRESLKNMQSDTAATNNKKEEGSFIVHIQCRQNATWQGNVVWAKKGISKNFRSALELLKLIDSALDETGVPQE